MALHIFDRDGFEYSSSLLEGTNIFMNVILVRVKLKVVDDAVSLLRNSYSAPGTCYCVPLFVSCCWPPFYYLLYSFFLL